MSGCNRLSLEERRIVGRWSWSSADATSEYVFRPNRSFVVLLPDPLDQTTKMKPAIYGAWAYELGFLILEYRADGSENFQRSKDRLPVLKLGADRIALRDGSYFKRVRD